MVFQLGMTGEILLPEQVHDNIIEYFTAFKDGLALASRDLKAGFLGQAHGAGIAAVGEEAHHPYTQLQEEKFKQRFLCIHGQPGAPKFLGHHQANSS